jgi:hypothetical protein
MTGAWMTHPDAFLRRCDAFLRRLVRSEVFLRRRRCGLARISPGFGFDRFSARCLRRLGQRRRGGGHDLAAGRYGSDFARNHVGFGFDWHSQCACGRCGSVGATGPRVSPTLVCRGSRSGSRCVARTGSVSAWSASSRRRARQSSARVVPPWRARRLGRCPWECPRRWGRLGMIRLASLSDNRNKVKYERSRQAEPALRFRYP